MSTIRGKLYTLRKSSLPWYCKTLDGYILFLLQLLSYLGHCESQTNIQYNSSNELISHSLGSTNYVNKSPVWQPNSLYHFRTWNDATQPTYRSGQWNYHTRHSVGRLRKRNQHQQFSRLKHRHPDYDRLPTTTQKGYIQGASRTYPQSTDPNLSTDDTRIGGQETTTSKVNHFDLPHRVKSVQPDGRPNTKVSSEISASRPPFSVNMMWTLEQDSLLSDEKVDEMWHFVVYYFKRFSTTTDPFQMFAVLSAWEKYQLKRQAEIEKERILRDKQRRNEKARFSEYHRQLRQFVNSQTKQHVKRVSKANNFTEFKRIIFDQKEDRPNSHIPLARTGVQRRLMPTEALIGPRLEYPIPGQPNVIASSSSSLQFPGGAGGGVLLKIMRSTRAVQLQDVPVKTNTNSANSDVASTSENIKTTTGKQAQDSYDDEPRYSEAELRSAFESYQEFRQTACQPKNYTLCTSMMLGLPQHHTNLVIPQGFHVQRCIDQLQRYSCGYCIGSSTDLEDLSDVQLDSSRPTFESDDLSEVVGVIDREQKYSCSCETPDEECVPTKVALKTQAVAIIQIPLRQRSKHSTELLLVTNHLSCGCQPRCTNRLCVPPTRFVMHTTSDCGCICEPGDHRCRALLEGKQQFTVQELPMPLNGSYILPPCRYGQMDDVHIYHRRCPRPVRKP
ncbi:hypothetical protein EG68_04029 [Paragonimus skrjabini miyazakii]|uniref:Platelet-derived growth factor (PDGF) family profile domain-containing protein n=1 Tax=Paragonimus skrjabini miyazakii TaxID=59628 RepID=A0A8S9Z0P0_9TREM|nr:hypothetical protein EG68_04029 [Paragonimus skrjabini miyazakii]